MLSMHAALLVLVDFADLSLGMVMLHLFTFDPAWLRGARSDPAVAERRRRARAAVRTVAAAAR